MEDNLNFLYMEYILIFLEMEEDLNYFANERWPQLFLWIAEGLKLFVFLMDDASIFFENGMQCKCKTTAVFMETKALT